MQLGGRPSLSDPLPAKPPRMHRQTYWRLLAAVITAQERSLGLEIEEARRHFPGIFTAKRGFPSTQEAAAGPATRSERFTPRTRASWNDRSRGALVQAERPVGV
jgi:hypothetical protein